MGPGEISFRARTRFAFEYGIDGGTSAPIGLFLLLSDEFQGIGRRLFSPAMENLASWSLVTH